MKSFIQSSSLTILLSLLIFLLIILKFASINYFEYNMFSDRDLIRALDLFNNFQFYGAELNGENGERVFGGFSYYYLWFYVNILKDIKLIYITFNILIVASFFFLCFNLKNFLHKDSILLILLFFFTSWIINRELLIFWNPMMGFHLLIISITFYIIYLNKNRFIYVLFGFLFGFFAAQFHFSYILILLTFYIFFLLKEKKNLSKCFRITLIIIITFLISYSFSIYNLLNSLLFNFNNSISLNSQSRFNIIELIEIFSNLFFLQSFVEPPIGLEINLPIFAIFSLIISYFIFIKNMHVFENKQKLNSLYNFVFAILAISLIINSLYLSLNHDTNFIIGYYDKVIPRYFLNISPIFAIISGLSIWVFWKYLLSTNNITKYFFTTFIIIFLIFRTSYASIKYIDKINNDINFYEKIVSYDYLKQSINLINDTFKINNYNSLLKRTSILSAVDSKINDQSARNFQYYINTKFGNKNYNSDGAKVCYLSLTIKNKNKIENYKDFLTSLIYDYNFLNIDILELKKIEINTDKNNKMLIVKYKTNNSLCMKHLSNNYILNTNEKQVQQFFSKNSENLYVINKDINTFTVLGNIKTNEVLNNLKFKIIFKKHDDLINLELFSKNLRNKTHLNGVWEQMILNNSKISFRNIKNNKIYYLTIFSGNLGEKNIFTPLNLYFNDKIPNGEYDIFLEADKLYELIFGLNHNERQLENFKIKIVDNLIIK